MEEVSRRAKPDHAMSALWFVAVAILGCAAPAARSPSPSPSPPASATIASTPTPTLAPPTAMLTLPPSPTLAPPTATLPPPPTLAPPTFTPNPTPTTDASLAPTLAEITRAFFAAYNDSKFVALSRYLSQASDAACGGTAKHGAAYSKLRSIEHLDYSLDGLVITGSSSTSATADVTFSSKDTRTGKRVDDHVLIGQNFTRELYGWTFADDPLFGVGAFCK